MQPGFYCYRDELVVNVEASDHLPGSGALALRLRDFAFGGGCAGPQFMGFDVYHFAYEIAARLKQIPERGFNEEWHRMTAPTFEKILSDPNSGACFLNFKRRLEFDPTQTLEQMIAAERALRPCAGMMVPSPTHRCCFMRFDMAHGACGKKCCECGASDNRMQQAAVAADPTLFGIPPRKMSDYVSDPACICVFGRARTCTAKHPGDGE